MCSLKIKKLGFLLDISKIKYIQQMFGDEFVGLSLAESKEIFSRPKSYSSSHFSEIINHFVDCDIIE